MRFRLILQCLIEPTKIYKEKLIKWIAIRIANKDKTVVIIIICRIPQLSSSRIYASLSQYNVVEAKVKGSTIC